MKTELARDLELSEGKEKYDTYCKLLLGEKVMLAWIMKSTISDYYHMSIREIQTHIEGEPEISAVRVNPGETNMQRIVGSQTEDRVPNEGVIFYDIRFFASVPGSKRKSRIIINVEAQKKFNPGYSVVTRGIFYAGRMLSAQLGTEFRIPEYDDIKKVYSIWVCTNAPDYIGNAISEFSIHKNDIVPGYPDKKSEYDKMSVILICLNDSKKNHNEITELLNTVFTEGLTAAQKKDILETKFSIAMENSSIGKELELMCNISDYIEERATARGMEKGMEKGIIQNKREVALRMLKKGMSDKDILEITGLNEQQLEDIKKEAQTSQY